MTRLVALLVTLVAMGCAAPSEVASSVNPVSPLAGMWQGKFLSPETGRAGTLQFAVTPSGDFVSGRAVLTDDGLPRSPGQAAPPVGIGVESVTLRDGEVDGLLAPYRDPGCGCWLDTAFRGRLIEGKRLLGTYTSRADAGEIAHGAWTAVRVGPAD